MGGLVDALFGHTGHVANRAAAAVQQPAPTGRPGMEYPELQPNLNPNDPYIQPQTVTSPGNANGRPDKQGFLQSMLPAAPAAPAPQRWTYVAGKGPQWMEQDPFGNPQAPKKPFTGNRV